MKEFFIKKIKYGSEYSKSVWISILYSLQSGKIIFEPNYEKKLALHAIVNSPSLDSVEVFQNTCRKRDMQTILRAINKELITREVDGASFYVTEYIAKDVLRKFDEVVPRVQRLFSPSWVEEKVGIGSNSLNSICQDLKKIAYLAAIAHLSSSDKQELNRVIANAKKPNKVRPEIDEALIEKAAFWGYSSHGNSGDGLKALDAARKDGVLAALSVYDMCLNGKLVD